jgi:trigger factor
LSSTETVEITPDISTDTDSESPVAAEHSQDHDHADHDHAGHDHTHPQGPALNPACTRDVEVTIPAEEVSKAFRSTLKRYQKQARIPGFRAGKVPESLIRGRFNEQIRQDVVESVLPEHFRAAIAESKLKPVSQPQVTELHLVDGEPLTFKAVFEVVPEIDITGYQEIKVQRPETTLTDEEVRAELDRVRDSRSTMEPVEESRPLVDGDYAQISFKGQVTDESAPIAEPIEGNDVNLEVGGANTLPAFNDALRGASVGQELKFEVSYPADFGEQRLAGRTIAYDVEIRGIKRKISPELNDEFAKELGEYESMDDFKTKMREHLASDKARTLEAQTKDQILSALANKYDFPVPETLVQQQIDAKLDSGLRALAQQGMSTEQMRQLDFNRIRAAQRENAVAEVKGMLLLDRIGDEEKIEVSNEELEQELAMLSVQLREPVETLRARLTADGSIAKLREQTRREKIGSLLYERMGA